MLKLTRQQLKESLLLYAITDRAWLAGRTLTDCVEQAISGGATFIQLREKNLTSLEFLEQAQDIREICTRYQIPYVVNDAIDIAQAVDADGVHIGQDDISCAEARLVLGEDKIIGVSATNVEEALLAERDGADYLGVGALFTTATKPDACIVRYTTLQAICNVVKIPVIGIGGLDMHTIPRLAGSGIVGAAVISALFADQDIKSQAKALKQVIKETVG